MKKKRYQWQKERKLVRELIGILITRHPSFKGKTPSIVDLKVVMHPPPGELTIAVVTRSFKFS